MIKKLLSLGFGLLALIVAVPALAATFTNVEFDNGDVNISGVGGSTVNATFRVVIPANQVVEYIETSVVGANLAPVCHPVSDMLGYQEGTHNVTLPIKLLPNTGTYNLAVKGAGIFGGNRSVDCNDNVVGNATFNGAIRTVAAANAVGGTGQTPLESMMSSLLAQLQALILSLKQPAASVPTPTPIPSPVVNPICVKLGSYAGLSVGSRGFQVSQLQRFLMDNGQGQTFYNAGVYSPTAYYGSITNSAFWNLKSAHNCQ